MPDMIPSVGAVVPTSTTRQDVVTKVYEGATPGSTKVHSTVYNVTVYDINGRLQTVTNSHVINYTV